MSGAAPVHRQLLAQAGMELRLLLRNGESLLISFGIPLGVLVFASRVVPVSLGPGEPLDTLVPAVLALSVLSTAFTAQAIQTGFQRKYGVLKRLRATPLSRTTFLGARALAVLALVAVQAVLVVAVGLALGWAWPPGASIGLLAVGLVLGTAVFTALALLLSGTLSGELRAGQLVLAAVGGLALRTDGLALPTQVAWATPSGALALLLGESLPVPGDDVGLGFLAAEVLLGWLVVAALAAARWFRWEP